MPFIYALCDPETDDIRYIGKANKVSVRLKTHLNEKGETRKCRWITSLRKRGLKPIVREMEEVVDADWQDAERRWIAHFRSLGCDLTNHTDGGDGITGASPETRAKLSAITKARMADPAFRARVFTAERATSISVSLKGLKKSHEHVAKLPQNKKGYTHKSGFAQKISIAMKGNKNCLGYRHKPEFGQRISQRLQGNKYTLGRSIPKMERLAKSRKLANRSKADKHKEGIANGMKVAWEKKRKAGLICNQHSNQPIIAWPSLSQLEEMLKTKTTKQLAAELGVKPGTLSGYLFRQRSKLP